MGTGVERQQRTGNRPLEAMVRGLNLSEGRQPAVGGLSAGCELPVPQVCISEAESLFGDGVGEKGLISLSNLRF